jgi:glycosyltransferase involved in cell wall biosynthesis
MLGGASLVRSISRSARRIIVPTHQVRRSLIDTYKLDPLQIVTIHYGVDMPGASGDQAAARKKIRKELGLPADALVVLGCGSVEARKGSDLFVQLARSVLHEVESSRQPQPAYFVWIGRNNDPNLRVWLDHDIRRSNLQGRILFVGQRDDPDAFFMGSDVFALPSREETFSLVTVEAMVRGVPALAFRDAGGAAEVLEGCGQTVPYLDVEAMARAVSRLLMDSDYRREQGQLARAFNIDRFSWTRFTSLLIPILKDHYGFTEGHQADNSDNRSTPQPRERRWWRSSPSGLPRANPVRGSGEMRSDRAQSTTTNV